MPPVNASEKLLEELAKRSFLTLWAYPNPFNANGKELCDLLVIYENNVIIFSIKSIKFNDKISIKDAWKRWYKKAVLNSYKQINGAIRCIDSPESKIYTDGNLDEEIKVPLPPISDRRFYRIIVAFGATEACKKFWQKERGSLILDDLASQDDNKIPSKPFTISRLNSDNFFHVMDDETFLILMKWLDTISDFIEYFSKKEEFLQKCEVRSSEENLLASYLRDTHSFTLIKEESVYIFDESFYDELTKSPNIIEGHRQNKISYLWDSLIEKFTDHFSKNETISQQLDGTQIDNNFENFEIGLRYLASYDRFTRREISKFILDCIEKLHVSNKPIFTRLITIRQAKEKPLLIIIFKPTHRDNHEERSYVGAVLYSYCMHYLEKDRNLKKICGIGMVLPNNNNESYETLIYLEQMVWGSENLEEIKNLREELKIGQSTVFRPYKSYEFPNPNPPRKNGRKGSKKRQSREEHKQRREAAKFRRKQKKPPQPQEEE